VQQVANVATLPGIVGPSIAMPDIHWGYGFPIGGVAAFDAVDGVVSPGGIGYDINCGVRMLASDLVADEIAGRLEAIVDAIVASVPSGVGSSRFDLDLGSGGLERVLASGASAAVRMGFGEAADLDLVEDQGVVEGADPGEISPRARERGGPQLGTLGSGNHFVELSRVDEVHDQRAAAVLGLFVGQLAVLIHTGSRGLGHQVCTEAVAGFGQAAREAGIALPDRQLVCAPLGSAAARGYLGAMAAAANFAFANRQIIGHSVVLAVERSLGVAPREHGLRLVYDVPHNIAKWESHEVGGRRRRLLVHRKGATRALPPGDEALPEIYREIGQPVLVPGDMGRASFVLVGSEGAARESFASACHGAGRLLSRSDALKRGRGRSVASELERQGILVRAASRRTLAEEMPEAYKDVEHVVDAVCGAGLCRRVARLRPLGVIKG
jgi:tRNA-splicing ligase RtcB